MKAFIKKYVEAVIYLLKLPANTKRLKNIQSLNTFLRKDKNSDIERWSERKELSAEWNERTAILGSFIKPNSNIIEFGAGVMFLKNYLKDYKSYTPSDIVKRYDQTVVCDLNRPVQFDLSVYNAAIFSGVLEYVYDVENVFRQLPDSLTQVAISYCCSDVMLATRDINGWLSDYTKAELETIFVNYGFTIENYQEWKKQSLYNLVKSAV